MFLPFTTVIVPDEKATLITTTIEEDTCGLVKKECLEAFAGKLPEVFKALQSQSEILEILEILEKNRQNQFHRMESTTAAESLTLIHTNGVSFRSQVGPNGAEKAQGQFPEAARPILPMHF